jgi:hypothetical protein
VRHIAFAIVILALTGCGSVGVENEVEAQLMPEGIAKKVLAKYYGREWVNSPTGHYSQGFGRACGNNGFDPFPFDDINVMRVFNFGQTTIRLEKSNWLFVAIPCQLMAHEIRGQFSETDINDIVDALVSLGAKIDEVQRK